MAKSGRCFTEPEESFCGNLRVEGDEECDAGLLGSEDSDECCDEYCKLKEHAKCSDKNSPCCSRCNYSKVGEVCRHANYATCEQASFKLEFKLSSNRVLYYKNSTLIIYIALFGLNDFRKRFATEKRPHVPFRQIWQMVPNALIEANVGVENAYPFVKHKICRSAPF